MAKEEFKNNLLKCSKLELIDMLMVQYEGLSSVKEQVQEAISK